MWCGSSSLNLLYACRDDLHLNVIELINKSKWEALEQMGKMKVQHGAEGPDGEYHPSTPSQQLGRVKDKINSGLIAK